MQAVTKAIDAVCGVLSPRQREVVFGRFGLDKKGEPQTLAELGKRYHVTRERIRQIEASALDLLKKEVTGNVQCADIVQRSVKRLKDAGGVLRAEDFFSYAASLADGLTEQHLELLREASGAFEFHPGDKHYVPFYYLDAAALKNAIGFINQWVAHVRSKKHVVLAGRYEDELQGFLKKKGVSKDHAANYLSISKKIHKNPFGDIGLAEWPEVKPQTVRDRVYLVLKKKATPLHFRMIAQSINQAKFDDRTASAPTVHNELIKDNRFVLVGRGMYALAEQGYEPGTAREVIHRLLKKQGALRPRDVILAIQKERFFKPNTILVNLQNKNFFERMGDGTYRVREA
jgi:hypothetical protein